MSQKAQQGDATVVRKFEEMRQSIQIRNSISQLRESVQKENGKPEEFADGNRGAHINSVVLGTEAHHHIDVETPFQQKAPVPPRKPATSKSQEDKAKEDIIAKVDHKISLDELLIKLSTSIQKGLTSEKAAEVLMRDGQNKLSEKKKTSMWWKLFKELTNGFALMLWVGAGLCFLAYGLTPEDPSNLYLAIVLLIVISITSGITFQQNAKSEALMDSFKNFLPQKSTVIRNNETLSIEAVDLVVGDIVIMKAGEKIPADIRIVESSEMKVDNSPLTGESEPLLRTVECSHPDNYLETSNLAFFGTLCKEGQGKGIVICTGDRTTLGQIADLSSGERKVETPLRKELDRFVVLITIIAVVLAVVFFLLAWLAMDMSILTCITFAIGILVANVPEGLLGCITISLAITAKQLAVKQVLVKNIEAVETLGSTSCICSDKTGTLTQNVMSVYHMWYGDKSVLTKNKSLLKQGEIPEYDEHDKDFRALQQAAMISSEARFDSSTLADKSNINYLTCPVLGDATETGLIRFYQYLHDVNAYRSQFPIVKNNDGTLSRMPFNSQVKFALTVVREETHESHFTVYVKGAPEKIWSFCKTVVKNGQQSTIDAGWNKRFKEVNLSFGKGGERVLGFARLRLPAVWFPINTQFTVSSVQKFNFKLADFEFCGLVSLMDPPKTRVPSAILECRSAGIKVIMVTGDQPPTAAAIAKEVNIIPRSVKTNEDIMEEDPSIDWFAASEKCTAIVVHGDRIVESIEKSISENQDQFHYLRQWVKKDYCVFARTTPAQKLQIVNACQSEGFIVAATGDGVNDSPAIKAADIGISMNLSGSDVTKDAADMILLDDDFASIVNGVEEGRKIFDNLKKTVVYLLTSNMTEIVPFLAFIILKLPIPLSSIFMVVICVGTDIWPAISLAYEEAELDVMTRRPRKKSEHLVSNKLITIAYLQTGQIASAAGFLGYYVTFNYFGFPIRSLFGMATFSGYHPTAYDFGSNLNAYTGQYDPFFNQALYNAAPDCTVPSSAVDDLAYDVDWLQESDTKYDLRKAFQRCNPITKQWEPNVDWSECDTTSSYTSSRIIPNTACYSTDAVKWAQSVYFVCIVLVQWSNVFTCKSRKMSFATTAFNGVMVQGIIFETLLTVFLLYVPGVQTVFGGRPLPFWMFGIPGLIFSIMLLTWDEIRKFIVRSNKWFLKYCLW